MAVGHEEKGPPVANGCQDCCNRRGKIVKPEPEKIPPEITRKEIAISQGMITMG
jgi:hypothetical protein